MKSYSGVRYNSREHTLEESTGSGMLEKLQERDDMLEKHVDLVGRRKTSGDRWKSVNVGGSNTRPLWFCADKPTGYGSSIRRAPQTGIVDECCFRSCDLRRLEMYCAPLKPTKSARSIRAQRHTDMPKTQKVSRCGWSATMLQSLLYVVQGTPMGVLSDVF